MDKSKKETLVDELKDKFSKAEAVFIADYSGIDVLGMTKLRKELRDAQSELKVVRNTLAKRAIEGTDVGDLAEHFTGPVAIAFSYKDSAATAKALTGFAKDVEQLEIKAGSLQGKVLDMAAIKSLSALPSKEELLAKLLGTLNEVPGSFVKVLAAVPKSFVQVVNAVGEQKK